MMLGLSCRIQGLHVASFLILFLPTESTHPPQFVTRSTHHLLNLSLELVRNGSIYTSLGFMWMECFRTESGRTETVLYPSSF